MPFVADDSQSASFAVGELRLELSAAPGAARLIVAAGDVRDVYVVDPGALAEWADSLQRLLRLEPAGSPTERAEYRAPYLIDREGRPSIAVEGLVAEAAVAYRLLISGAESRVAGLMTSVELVRGLAEAASGAVAVARAAPIRDP